MRKTGLLAALLIAAPIAVSAQETPDSVQRRQPGMQGQARAEMQQRMRDMTPEQRREFMQQRREGRGKMGPGERGAGALMRELNLTEDQQRRLAEIRERQREQHREGMDALRADREKWLQQRTLFREQTRALMLEVLTPEQRTRFEQLEAQRKEARKDGRKERGPRAPRAAPQGT